MRRGRAPIEWPTLGLVLANYALLALSLSASGAWLWLAIPLAGLAITLHASLQHEVIHGHPLPWRWLSVLMVLPPIGLAIPFERFRDTHLAHHRDARLTDPYDDPESFYLAPHRFDHLPKPVQTLLRLNNTLAGRIVVGPAIGFAIFWADEARAMVAGDRALRWIWLRHGGMVALVLVAVAAAPMPLWAYGVAAYLGHAILKIRTFAEHRAHEAAAGRSVIIEDRGLLALLFLNNNLHAVHHAHPAEPWYRLPALYRARREGFLARNRGYRYAGYGALFRAYFLRRKEPVIHPFWDP